MTKQELYDEVNKKISLLTNKLENPPKEYKFYADYAHSLTDEIQEMRASGNVDAMRLQEIVSQIAQTQDAINQLSGKIENINIVMDSGELVGAIAPSMDNELGRRTIYMKRGV